MIPLENVLVLPLFFVVYALVTWALTRQLVYAYIVLVPAVVLAVLLLILTLAT